MGWSRPRQSTTLAPAMKHRHAPCTREICIRFVCSKEMREQRPTATPFAGPPANPTRSERTIFNRKNTASFVFVSKCADSQWQLGVCQSSPTPRPHAHPRWCALRTPAQPKHPAPLPGLESALPTRHPWSPPRTLTHEGTPCTADLLRPACLSGWLPVLGAW